LDPICFLPCAEQDFQIMVDITHKQDSLRQAVATALLTVSKPETIEAIRNRKVPKGDVFEFSRAAGLLAIKNTYAVIPDCHPLPVEFAAISHEIDGLTVRIRVEVHTIYKTGVEVEAMHGASITALTMYDMLKPIDKGVEISSIRLESKKGGKSDKLDPRALGLRAAVVVVSDSVSAGTKEDRSGALMAELLDKQGIQSGPPTVVPDDVQAIQLAARRLVAEGFHLVLFTGGTGLSPRDVTPDAISPMLDREIPGIMETARRYGQERMPFAMLSRGVAGFIGESLVITMPGSPTGVKEYMDALFPQVLHLFRVKEGARHD
jgi:molybdenum cofactor biosynthesis protein MoaC